MNSNLELYGIMMCPSGGCCIPMWGTVEARSFPQAYNRAMKRCAEKLVEYEEEFNVEITEFYVSKGDESFGYAKNITRMPQCGWRNLRKKEHVDISEFYEERR